MLDHVGPYPIRTSRERVTVEEAPVALPNPQLSLLHAPNEITKAAKDLDVDLIIIATHGYTSWRHLCIGSTAERVVRTAPCPVLVVREKEHEFV